MEPLWRHRPDSGKVAPISSNPQVYGLCMSRTNIDVDEEACLSVMRRYQLRTKRDAVNFALRTLAAEMLELDEARRMRGTGWEGDLDEMRLGRGW